MTDPPWRVLQVISRLTGGAGYQVALLGGRLDRGRYTTLVAHGVVSEGEASLEPLAEAEHCNLHKVHALGPAVRPLADLRALLELTRLVRRFRPQIVHTHAAKAGALGRVAVVLAGPPRPVILHTYHGHVLEGYFGRVQNLVYRTLERGLARFTDGLVAVSTATAEDLERLRVADRDRFRVIPEGRDLKPFLSDRPDHRERFRRKMGVERDEILLLFSGRLVPIKRVDVLLHALARLSTDGMRVKLAILGNGPCRPRLEALAGSLKVQDRVGFLGFVADVTEANAAADIAVLTSENEGTPVALIEASAAGLPVVGTAVGGVPDVVSADSGILVPPGDERAVAEAISELVRDKADMALKGLRGREHVADRFSIETVVNSIDQLYQEFASKRSGDYGIQPAGSRRKT